MPWWGTILGIAFALFLFYVYIVETRWLKFERLQVKIAKPLLGDEISILHLSDTHFKKRDARKVEIFRTLGRKQYDLILITGDIIDDYHGNLSALKALSYLRARHGIYCVFGNHEYLHYRAHHGIQIILGRKFLIKKNPRLREFKEGIDALGIHHLGNRHQHLRELGVTLVGVDDFKAGMSRMEKAAENLSTEYFNILLAHHPDSLLAASPGQFDLALCGHTHGGQMRLPFVGALFTDSKLPKHLAMGRVQINGIDTYISRGFSSSRFMSPRFLCRPEITEIVLAAQA